MMRVAQNSSQCVIKMKITNHTVDVLRDFVFKVNVNYFGYTLDEGVPANLAVPPGTTLET